MHEFYRGVAGDPVLRALYPEDDLGPAEERLRLFLIQYWGGPQTYSRERGHPRLRMRHAPFAINEAARDAWLRHMRAAVDSLDLPPAYEQTLWTYLSRRRRADAQHAGLSTLLRRDAKRFRASTRGGRPPSSTRSTRAASPTATATAPAT